jgi:uncharacterized protein involved in exopolysaccharide biosynthesis
MMAFFLGLFLGGLLGYLLCALLTMASGRESFSNDPH